MEKLRAYLKDKPHFVILLGIGALGVYLAMMPNNEMKAAGGVLIMVAGIAMPIYALAWLAELKPEGYSLKFNQAGGEGGDRSLPAGRQDFNKVEIFVCGRQTFVAYGFG